MAFSVGTCAWTDHEDFYPPGVRPGERLAYYARFFPLVEDPRPGGAPLHRP